MFKNRQLKHTLPDPAHMMVIHGRAHQRACDQERFGSVHPVLVKHRTFGSPDKVTDKALGIHGAIRSTGVIRIPEQIIHPVHIEISVDNTGQRVFSFHHCAELIGIDTGCTELAPHLVLDDQIDIIVGAAEEFFHEGFTRMGERAMTDIVEQRCGNNEHTLVIR